MAHNNSIFDLLLFTLFSCALHTNASGQQCSDTAYVKGLISFKQGNFDDAIDYFNQTSLNCKSDSLYYLRGVALFLNHQNVKAKQYFDSAIIANPVFVDAYIYRGSINRKLGNLTLALADFDTAISRSVNDEMPYFHRATVNYDVGNYNLAKQDYETAIKINPQNSLIFYYLGKTYAKLKNYKNAESNFSIYLEKTPSFSDAYVRRAFVRLSLNKAQKACEDFRKACELGNKKACKLLYKYCKRQK